MNNETIAAIATPPGTGGVAIIRISGNDAPAVLRRVFSRAEGCMHANMVYGSIVKDGEILDNGYAVLFEAPRSYTGEHIAELHCHGGQAGLARVLDAVLQSGARAAQPGEFTKRAFLNGKMDLTQAEGVADFIAAAREQSARVSLRQMRGELKEALENYQDVLTDVLARAEAAIEYPEEDLEPVVTEKILPVLKKMRGAIVELEKSYDWGKIIKDGFEVTIAGKPNVGKSSLMNALVGFDRAIVTEQPGTTRDTLEHSFSLNGTLINMTDTAGIRETRDIIENEGILRANQKINQGDLTIFVLDPTQGISEEDRFICKRLKQAEGGVIVVINKIDLSQSLSEKETEDLLENSVVVRVSALTGEGIEELKHTLYGCALPANTESEGLVITNARHRQSLRDAAENIDEAIVALENGMDMDCVTIDLNAAWNSLGELTGRTVSEDIINRIFEKFCLGK